MSKANLKTPPPKVDLYKLHKADYVTPKSPVVLDVSPAQYLSIDGRGEPGGDAFSKAIGALMAFAFTIKMTNKFAGRDYSVAKLEGQWWVDSKRPWDQVPRDQWNWRLLIRTPDFISIANLDQARAQLQAKGKPEASAPVKLIRIDEGRSIQVLHTGSYDSEHLTILRMKAFADERKLAFNGLHHEIYLSDPRRVPAARLRTILRMPVKA